MSKFNLDHPTVSSPRSHRSRSRRASPHPWVPLYQQVRWATLCAPSRVQTPGRPTQAAPCKSSYKRDAARPRKWLVGVPILAYGQISAGSYPSSRAAYEEVDEYLPRTVYTGYNDIMVATRTKAYASVAKTTRTSQKTLLQEAAEVGVSFDEQNRPVVLTAEGEFQSGSLPAVDQHALSVARIPRIHPSNLDEHLALDKDQKDGHDEEELRNDSLTSSDNEYSFDSQGCVDWENPEGGFVVPRHTAKKNYEWLVSDKLDTKLKFFPTWFDLSEDEDQLGPIPEEWLKQEDMDLPNGVYASIEEAGKKRTNEPIRSMAVIVEVSEEAPGASQSNKVDSKGKDIGAGERSTGFAAYLRQMQAEAAKSHRNQSRKAARDEIKKAKKEKANFSRLDSQVPEGGWFRATTSKSGGSRGPPNSKGPPDSPDDSSSSSSSDPESSSSSSDESNQSSGSSSSLTSSSTRRKSASERRRDKHKLGELKTMKKAMAGIKIKAPFVWDGKPVMDTFDHWTYEVDTWIELTALTDKLAMKLIVNFMSGTASKFFMDHVSTELKKWTVKDVYRALFNYCFPADFKLRLRKRLMNAYQGKKTQPRAVGRFAGPYNAKATFFGRNGGPVATKGWKHAQVAKSVGKGKGKKKYFKGKRARVRFAAVKAETAEAVDVAGPSGATEVVHNLSDGLQTVAPGDVFMADYVVKDEEEDAGGSLFTDEEDASAAA
ncbi:hypothetical protein DFH09DRAFT_1359264 [Mycena vulgaris]|nr:hypothetical protein DFH09DRAFT_1359264 [Mycena vulgaris]